MSQVAREVQNKTEMRFSLFTFQIDEICIYFLVIVKVICILYVQLSDFNGFYSLPLSPYQ